MFFDSIRMNLKRKVLPWSVIVLVVLQAALVLFSWIVASVWPYAELRSVLSGEGVRWYFGSFVDNMSCPLLVWLLLGFMAYGTYSHSGLKDALCSLWRGERLAYRCRHAVYTVAVVACVMVFVVVMLAFVPHAVLLGVSGGLFPSAFSSALVPIITFSITVLSIIYGMASGGLAHVGDILRSLYSGVVMFAPFMPVYVLAVQLYYLVVFVFAVG